LRNFFISFLICVDHPLKWRLNIFAFRHQPFFVHPIKDLNYLTGTVLNLMKDDRNINGPNESVYSVIDIFLIVIGFELDEINLEQLNYSEQDEKELLSNLDNIAKILEDYQTGTKINVCRERPTTAEMYAILGTFGDMGTEIKFVVQNGKRVSVRNHVIN
jgi:hypothetical protein